jgi:hypothetical protein
MNLELSLTQALLATAAVVLLGLGLHSWWKLRQARPRRAPARPAPRAAGPAAASDSRVEPSLDPALAGETPDTELLDPPEDAADTLAELPGLRPSLRRPARLDPLIDALVPIALEHPVTGEAVLLHLPPTRRAGSKPYYVEGLDLQTGDWDHPQPGRRYSELQAGLQLVNRGGPVNEIEFSEFVQKVQAFADSVQGTPSFPDMLEVVEDARKLDAATHPLDAQLTVTLRSNGVVWSVGYIQQCAARHGFVAGAVPGRLVVPASEEGAPPLLSIQIEAQAAWAAFDSAGDGAGDPQASAVRSFMLSLDVPQTPQAAEAFPAWHRVATALAEDMDASIVDDHGQPLPLSAFPSIAQELEQLYEQLEAMDLPAGSAAARRLFS